VGRAGRRLREVPGSAGRWECPDTSTLHAEKDGVLTEI
jgi:UDP-2-acetamido-3-amino-2,3-dideoxy-glucuronate N-acetyltransferase